MTRNVSEKTRQKVMDSEVTTRSWENFKMPDKRYFFKMTFRNSGRDHGYEVSWTDMMSVWTESVGEEVIKQRTQTLNPGIEVPVDTLLTHLEANTRPEHCSMTEVPGEGMMVDLNMDLSGIPFGWRFQCTQMPQKQLLETFIQPLMIMTAELYRRQAFLVDLLQKKDVEIEDYQMQGFSTTRKRIKTKPFDETEFADSMLKSKEFDSVIRSSHDLVFDDPIRGLFDSIMKRQRELQYGNALQNVDDNMDGPTDVSAGAVSAPPQQHVSPKKSDDNLLTEDEERERREALNRRLAEKRHLKVEKDKKKKKKAL